MKQIFKNCLSDFLFHDAWVMLISYEQSELKLNLNGISHKNEPNSYIENATITFNNFSILNFKYPKCTGIFTNGTFISIEEPEVHVKDHELEFLNNLKKRVQILDIIKLENNYIFAFDIIGEKSFECEVIFNSSTIEYTM